MSVRRERTRTSVIGCAPLRPPAGDAHPVWCLHVRQRAATWPALALAKQRPFAAGPKVLLHGIASRTRDDQGFAVPWTDDPWLPSEAPFQRGSGRYDIERYGACHEPNAAIDHGQCVAGEERLLRAVEIGHVSWRMTRCCHDLEFVQDDVAVL